MLLSEYTTIAATTAAYPPDKGVEYTALALVSEVGELFEKVATGDLGEVGAEAGDVLWNVAMAVRELDLGFDTDLAAVRPWRDPQPLHIGNEALVDLVGRSAYFAGRISKRIRDGHHAVDDATILSAIVTVIRDLAEVCCDAGTTLADVARANNAKLADRAHRGVIAGDGDHR